MRLKPIAQQTVITAGGKAIYVVADVGQQADVHKISEAALLHYGSFDIWFDNAGVTIFGKTEEVSLADHRRLFDTNYWGVVHGSLIALAHFSPPWRSADQHGQHPIGSSHAAAGAV